MCGVRTPGPLLVAAALVLGGVAAAAGDTHPGQQRGFAAEKSFQIGDVDHVNLFSGSLTLTIPLAGGSGGTYPVSESFDYALTLTYSSNVWDFREVNGFTESWPVKGSNAGVGWRLHLGDLLDLGDPDNFNGKWVYVSADGAEHLLFHTLHEDDPDDAGDDPASTTNQAVWYSRDSTYLRMRKQSATVRTVEFLDGEVHTFTKNGTWDWRLTQIADRFGSGLTIAYPDSLTWTLTDTVGRQHTVSFMADPYYSKVVRTVALTAFDDPATPEADVST